MTAVPYQVAWRWRGNAQADINGSRDKFDDVDATDAVRAMNKVFKSLAEEYSITRRDVIFLEVYRI